MVVVENMQEEEEKSFLMKKDQLELGNDWKQKKGLKRMTCVLILGAYWDSGINA